MKLRVGISKDFKNRAIEMALDAGFTVTNTKAEGPSPVLNMHGGRRAPLIRALKAEFPRRFWYVATEAK